MKRFIKSCTCVILALVFVMQLFAASVPVRTVSASEEYVVTITGGTVNVRKGAGTGYSKIGTSHKGDKYAYLGQTTVSGVTWYKIQYTSSKVGWITGRYSKKSSESTSTSASVAANTSSAVNKYIASIAKSYGADGIQVALIENGVVTETYNYGYATKYSRKMTSDTKIRVASLSKVAVAMMAMKMSEQGIVDLNANISKYWGSTYKKITLNHILTHTSALGSRKAKSSVSTTRSQLRSSSYYRKGTSGSKGMWMYNNYAFNIGGSTLEVAAKTTLDKYGDKYFFNSLGADISWRSGKVDTSKLATLYFAGGGVARSVATQKKYKGSNTPGSNTSFFAGGLTCSAKDYAKLIAILANDGTYDSKRYLEESSVAEMEKKLFVKSSHGGSFYQCKPLRYKANLYGESELYYHTGNAYGVLSLASYNPTTRNGVVVVSTGATSYRDSQGVYRVCSYITKYVYSYMKNKQTEDTTTTTTTTSTTTTTTTTTETTATTSATDIVSSATDATVTTTVSTQAATSATDITTVPTTESTVVSITDITQTSTTATSTSESQTTTTTIAETTTAAVTTTTASATEMTTVPTTVGTAATVKLVKVTGAVVNVRSKAGTGNTIITTVKKGKTYEYTATKKVGSVTWYKINVSSSVSGWISGAYAVEVNTGETAATTVSTAAASKNRVKITVSNLNVRKGAGTKYGIVTVVRKGSVYEYTATKKVGGKTWYKIKVSNTVSGWVCGTYVKKVS